MKAFIMILILATPNGGMFPPQEVPMPSLKACLDEVQARSEKVSAIDDDFSFTAACTIRSEKTKEG